VTLGPTDYTDIVLDHYRAPRNVGDLPDATGVGTAGNPEDGDFLRLAIRVEKGRLAEVRFQTFGCPAAIAAGSVATELLAGRTLDQVLSFGNHDVVTALGGLPKPKLKCSVLAEQALRVALRDHYERSGESVPGELAE